jgi:hypothetical protein
MTCPHEWTAYHEGTLYVRCQHCGIPKKELGEGSFQELCDIVDSLDVLYEKFKKQLQGK